MSNNILFWPDVNYEPGHWRPIMAMAKRLKEKMAKENRACNIKFLCTPECKPIVERVTSTIFYSEVRWFNDNEIETILADLFPIGYSSLASERPEEARSRIDHCLRIAEGEFDNMLRTFKPRLLIAGYFASMEALIIKHRYDKVIRDKNVDPEMEIIITTTFLRHPSEDPAITSLRFLAHHAQEHSSKLMQVTTGDSKYNGSLSSIQEFIEPLEVVTELITCPKELDHDHFEHREKTYYVEPCILDTNPNRGRVKDAALIYASAGSRVRDYVESARTMFKTLEDMSYIAAANSRRLEMAVGYTLEEAFANNNNTNITIKEWADQTDSLKRAQSAVVHGGLATIKECIYFGIPPIVIPLGKDQMDNALRVVNKEVGSMIMLGGLTAEALYDAIMCAEENSDIKNSLKRMKERFRAEEESEPSIGHIKEKLGII